MIKFIGIIPSRFASTRFPGKPLANINGKTMIKRVYERASQVLNTLIVATDDERIYREVLSFGGKAVMTSESHQSGTDRCYEALMKFSEFSATSYDVVINIQGDEPFIRSDQIELLKGCFMDANVDIATLIKPIEDNDLLFNPNKPKVVINNMGEALYFSRSPIPYIRDTVKENWYKNHRFYQHIGMYAYRSDVLKRITGLKIAKLEKAESLEQLRWLENGLKIQTAVTAFESHGIDTPEDLNHVLKLGLFD
jgi:3-deoxy-manno-octulosonate cytidylyltransferase (CMP-KDO synthetase)